MACHYVNKDGFCFFTDKDENPEYIVYKYGDLSKSDKTPIEKYIRAKNYKKFIIMDSEDIGKTVDSLIDFPELESLRIYSSRDHKVKYDVSVFNKLKNLQSLSCELKDITLNLPKLKALVATFGKNTVISPECKMLETVTVHRCNDYGHFWSQMQKFPSVKRIDLTFGTLPDLSSICELPKLEELRFLYLKKLSDIKGIVALKNTLKSLWFEEAAGKNITDWSPLGELTKLEELVINNNSVISDLHFLDSLLNLKSFRFWGVKITAEDLSPLVNVKEVAYYGTGIDKKLDAVLSAKKKDFMNKENNNG